jgi:hypothetical protein
MASFYLFSALGELPKRIRKVVFAWNFDRSKIEVKHVIQNEVYCHKCDAITPTYRQECCVCGTYKD